MIYILFLALAAGRAWAYPQFIGMGYTSCMNCHYNPLGNGPLTDYGRAVSASIADRILYPNSWSEEKLADSSGFFFNDPKQKWFRPSFDYRTIRIIRNPGKDTEETISLDMQADGNIVLKAGERDQYLMSFTFGVTPKPMNPSLSDEPRTRSREHYVGARLGKYWGVYAGLMDIAYGIRHEDHTAFSRSTTGLAMNDQSHGVLLHSGKSEYDLGLHYLLGNLSQEEELRQKGYAATGEYTVGKQKRIGVSYLSTKSHFLEKNIFGPHARFGFGKGHSVLFELGRQERKKTNGEKVISNFFFWKNQVKLRRGFFAGIATEYYKPDSREETSMFRFSPHLQYFPAQRLEFRLDLFNTKVYSESAASEDSWDIVGQVHLWL